MKVKELIDLLRLVDGEMDVCTSFDHGCWGPVRERGIFVIEVDARDYDRGVYIYASGANDAQYMMENNAGRRIRLISEVDQE